MADRPTWTLEPRAWCRSRPDGDNPDSCIYDVWGLQRYAPGSEPTIDRRKFLGRDDWRGVGAVSLILEQDFFNMEQVQLGMKSYGFPGNRTNPEQEVAISNMHRALREEFLFAERAVAADAPPRPVERAQAAAG